MSDSVTVNLHDEQIERLKSLKESGVASSISEAARVEIGTHPTTPLRQATQRVGDAFTLVGIMMLGLTFAMPLEIRAVVVGPLIAGVTCYVVDRVLKRVEPSVSNRLLFWRGGSA